MDHEERHHQRFEISPLFVGILAILSGALVVATLHCIIIGWCNSRRRSPSPQNRPRIARAGREESMLSSNSTSNSAGSDKLVVIYKHSDVEEDKEGTCAVCLSEFAEGEEVRILPECAHSFHLACIDVWLHSHPNCPLCRADAAPPQL